VVKVHSFYSSLLSILRYLATFAIALGYMFLLVFFGYWIVQYLLKDVLPEGSILGYLVMTYILFYGLFGVMLTDDIFKGKKAKYPLFMTKYSGFGNYLFDIPYPKKAVGNIFISVFLGLAYALCLTLPFVLPVILYGLFFVF